MDALPTSKYRSCQLEICQQVIMDLSEGSTYAAANVEFAYPRISDCSPICADVPGPHLPVIFCNSAYVSGSCVFSLTLLQLLESSTWR